MFMMKLYIIYDIIYQITYVIEMQHKLLIRLIHNLYCTYIQLRILYCSSQDSVELIIDVARTSDVLEQAMNSKGSLLPRNEL